VVPEFGFALPLLEAIVSYIDEGVLIARQNGDVVYMNPAAHQLLALPPNTAITRLGDVPGIDLAGVMTDANCGATRRASPGLERTLEVGDDRRTLQFDCSRTSAADGGMQLFIIRDVTHQRMLETCLNRASRDLITADPKMMEILQRVEQVAPANVPVLLTGESGTGKTHIARLIHRLGRRASGPFVEVNCAAIPETLIESELFGHVKGAFTGATQRRKGRFQTAHKGTLFLDEIGEIPLHLQAKLLRVLQDQEFEPVGSDEPVKVDVRIVASTNQPLRSMVDQGKFRSDLYYRLAVFPIHVPPLRQRPADIPLLLKHFCHNLTARGFAGEPQCSAEAMRLMMNYPWPGNIRELSNAVEHAVICAVNGVVLPESLPHDVRDYRPAPPSMVPSSTPYPAQASASGEPPRVVAQSPQDRERAEIESALAQAKGNRVLAAEALGIDRTTLWRRMQRLKLDQPSGGSQAG
jgi:transcriptional regulator with GAF, ATPase, and Fis domain